MTIEEFSAYVSGREFPEDAELEVDEDRWFCLKMNLQFAHNADLHEYLCKKEIHGTLRIEICGIVDHMERIGQIDNVSVTFKRKKERSLESLDDETGLGYVLDDLLESF